LDLRLKLEELTSLRMMKMEVKMMVRVMVKVKMKIRVRLDTQMYMTFGVDRDGF
jgi:hypothetical protein